MGPSSFTNYIENLKPISNTTVYVYVCVFSDDKIKISIGPLETRQVKQTLQISPALSTHTHTHTHPCHPMCFLFKNKNAERTPSLI